VRALDVELRNEVIELRLLLQKVGTCWLDRLMLQGQIHAFMPAILLRLAWLDPLDTNPAAATIPIASRD
jgi:hypothetical protein